MDRNDIAKDTVDDIHEFDIEIEMKIERKLVFVLIDGIGDVSVRQLDGKTPLEAARIPYMDAVAGACI